jgi:hypothetical protein
LSRMRRRPAVAGLGCSLTGLPVAAMAGRDLVTS